jgi:hypothetical protein
MKNLGNMMKQAQEMQAKMAEMQERLADKTVEGHAGGGMVRVIMTGKGMAQKVSIDPSLTEQSETEVLEDLLVAAINDGRTKVEEMIQEETQEIMGGLPLPPGMKLPF